MCRILSFELQSTNKLLEHNNNIDRTRTNIDSNCSITALFVFTLGFETFFFALKAKWMYSFIKSLGSRYIHLERSERKIYNLCSTQRTQNIFSIAQGGWAEEIRHWQAKHVR